ncbi:CDGSH iron-sulfur domain-containing protein [Candidatus Palauibacter sp.]|uniref:CDGSH iron-sulfur domain-containing protein n=1 Tax=Candidatus Palauibacter sp. TaxID=3101350 RepID=UPI003B5BF431
MPTHTDGDSGEVCTVRCEGDGPLLAQGPLRVRVPGEEDARSESRVWFCRCGHSGNKPFCDGSHRDAGFEASGPINTTRAVASDHVGEDRAGVVVGANANGPYRFDGVIELSGAGHEGTARFASPSLCRCGASKNKPFCDGAHKEIEFEAEGL